VRSFRPRTSTRPRRALSAGWAFLPALGAALAHAPVLRYDLLPQLARPLDGGSGLFGANKTWRGALMMGSGTVAATLGLTRLEAFRSRLAPELREAPPAAYGTLLGASVVLGELPNSFLKRRLGVEPGKSGGPVMSVLDQGDFVLFSRLALAPVWRMSGPETLAAFALVAGVHSVINVIGYAIGARTSPV
jgi:hypothetical protein